MFNISNTPVKLSHLAVLPVLHNARHKDKKYCRTLFPRSKKYRNVRGYLLAQAWKFKVHHSNVQEKVQCPDSKNKEEEVSMFTRVSWFHHCQSEPIKTCVCCRVI